MKKFLTLFATAALLVTGCGHDMDSYVEISPNALEALKEGGELTIQVHSNTQWTFVGDNQAWYTASPVSGEGDGTVVLTLEPNRHLRRRNVGPGCPRPSGIRDREYPQCDPCRRSV